MATTVLFDVIDALFTQATAALPNVKVFDSYQLTKQRGPDILMIGVDDGQSAATAQASNSSQTQATAGTPRSRQEVGSINCWDKPLWSGWTGAFLALPL